MNSWWLARRFKKELENVLGIGACAMAWPLGNGTSFKGVFDRQERAVHLFERVPGGAYRAPVQVTSLEDPSDGCRAMPGA